MNKMVNVISAKKKKLTAQELSNTLQSAQYFPAVKPTDFPAVKPADITPEPLAQAFAKTPPQVYPQAAPKAAPSIPFAPTDVKFNPDKTVTLTMGAADARKSFTLNKEEYKAYLMKLGAQSQGGTVTPQVEEISTLEKERALRQKMAEEIEQSELGEKIKSEYLMKLETARREELQPLLNQLLASVPETSRTLDMQGMAGALTTLGASTLAGAAAGAGIGALFAGAGAVPGAVVGAVGGFATGAITKITAGQRQNVKTAYTTFTTSKLNMAKIINAVNAGQIGSADAVAMWNEELINIGAAERYLKIETSNDVKKFISGGADELANVENYKALLPIYYQQMQMALISPKKENIITLGLTEDDLGDVYTG